MKCPLQNHPQRSWLRLQLRRNPLIAGLDDSALDELAESLVVREAHRGECLLQQGAHELHQFFVIEGLLKRIVASPGGREMTLRFAGAGDFETCYEGGRNGVAPYSIVCAQRCCVITLPMSEWCAFLSRHPQAQQAFHERVVALGASLVEHTIGLLLLDAPARVHAFTRQHPQLVGQLVQRDLASHLNLTAETLCRLSRRAEAM